MIACGALSHVCCLCRVTNEQLFARLYHVRLQLYHVVNAVFSVAHAVFILFCTQALSSYLHMPEPGDSQHRMMMNQHGPTPDYTQFLRIEKAVKVTTASITDQQTNITTYKVHCVLP